MELFWKIFRSIFITLAVAVVLGSLCGVFFGNYEFWIVLLVLLQLIGFGIYNGIIKTYSALTLKRIEAEMLKTLANNSAIVSCNSCKATNVVPIIVNERNPYTCTHCNAKNVAVVEVTSALITDFNENNENNDTP